MATPLLRSIFGGPASGHGPDADGGVRMFGVPANLDLSFLLGAVLAQVHLMPHQVNFVFDPEGRFFVEGEWRLFAADGSTLDRSLPWPRT